MHEVGAMRQVIRLNVHYGLKQDALTATLVHFLGEVCPRSRPLRKASAAAAKSKRAATTKPSA